MSIINEAEAIAATRETAVTLEAISLLYEARIEEVRAAVQSPWAREHPAHAFAALAVVVAGIAAEAGFVAEDFEQVRAVLAGHEMVNSTAMAAL